MPAFFYDDSCYWSQINEKPSNNNNNTNSLLKALLSQPVSTTTTTNESASLSPRSPHAHASGAKQQEDLVAKFDDCLNDEKCAAVKSRIPFDNYRRIEWNWTTSKANENHVHIEHSKVSIHPHCGSKGAACFETYAVMGDRPLKKNALTYWEIKLSNEDNKLAHATSIMIGVGTSKAKLSSIGYLNLIGIDNNGWALSNSGHIWHDNQPKFYTSQSFVDSENDKSAVIGCLYDGYTGQLSFYKNGQCLNLSSFSVNAGDYLYPVVSSTMANTQFRLEFVYESQQNLQELCKSQILKSYNNNLIKQQQQQQQSSTAASSHTIKSSSISSHLHHQSLDEPTSRLPKSIIHFLLN